MAFSQLQDNLTNLQLELQRTPRLQWLLLVVATILCVSALKGLHTITSDAATALEPRQAQWLRLNRSLSYELPDEQVEQLKAARQRWEESVPVALSQSSAEAEALSQIDREIGDLLSARKRLELITTESSRWGDSDYWQIRLQVSGQLAASKIPQLLTLFDNTNLSLRLESFRFRPTTSNQMTLVVDALYRQAPEQ